MSRTENWKKTCITIAQRTGAGIAYRPSPRGMIEIFIRKPDNVNYTGTLWVQPQSPWKAWPHAFDILWDIQKAQDEEKMKTAKWTVLV